VSRRKGHAKRRRRKRPKLTAEQLIALEVSRRAAENRLLARAERSRRSLLDVMDARAVPPDALPAEDLSRWELCELARVNAGRTQPIFHLPPSAYEATRLMKYVES
jgi:hypothetical protein